MSGNAQKLRTPLLCLITDRTIVPPGRLAELVAQAVAGGVGMVQLREKDLPPAELIELARELKEACGGNALLLVNGSPEAAAAARADGLHLPEDGIPMAEARRRAPGVGLIGRSAHSLAAALKAKSEGADYLIVGTVFETRSKPGKEPEGLGLVREVSAAVRIPILGIGGITAASAASVMEAGAAGVAAVSAILGAAAPEAAAREIRQAIGAPDGPPTGIIVNGKHEALAAPTPLLAYLQARLDPGRMVAIGHNGQVVHRSDWGAVMLKEGDVLDIVHMVGGGC